MIELTQEQLTDFLEEIKTSQRIIAIGVNIVVVCKPTAKTKNDSKIVYSKILTHLLADGVPSKAECRKLLLEKIKASGKDPRVLENREAISRKIVDSLQNLNEELAPEALMHPQGLIQLIHKTTAVLTSEERAQMEELAELEELEVSLMTNAAEVLAAAERDLFLLQRCILKADGTPYWPTDESIHAETDLDFLTRVQEEFQRFLMGLPLLFEATIPEDVREKIKNSQRQ